MTRWIVFDLDLNKIIAFWWGEEQPKKNWVKYRNNSERYEISYEWVAIQH